MIILLMPCLACFSVLLWSRKRTNSWLRPNQLPIYLYLFSSLAGLIIYMLRDGYIVFLPVFVLSLAFLFVLAPLVFFNTELPFRSLRIPERHIVFVSHLVIWPSLYAFFFYVRFAGRVFNLNVGESRRLHSLGMLFEHYGMAETVAAAACSLYLLAILLMFLLCIWYPKRHVLILLLFVASFSEVLRVFYQYGRDGVVFWVLPFVQLYFLFRNLLPNFIRSVVLALFSVSFSFLFLAFSIISYARFAYSGGTGYVASIWNVFESFLLYFGQGGVNYTSFYDISHVIRTNGIISFSWIMSLLGLSSRAENYYVLEDYYYAYANHHNGAHAGVFGTFMREWTVDFGPYGALLVSFVLMLFSIAVFRVKTASFQIFKLYYFAFYSLFLFQGVFYFRMKFNHSNLMILMALGCVVFGYLYARMFPAPNPSVR